MVTLRRVLGGAVLAAACAAAAFAQSFVEFETVAVRPMALSASGTELYAVNTPDNQLEILNVGAGGVSGWDEGGPPPAGGGPPECVMRSVIRSVILGFLLLLASSARGAAAPAVSYTDGRLTAHLEAADPTETLQEIARQAGLEIRGTPVSSEPLTLSLESTPLPEALPRLLGAQSFLLSYSKGHLKRITLIGGSDAVSWTPPPPVAASEAAPSAEDDGSGPLAASHRSVAIGGRLARVLGRDETSFSEVLGVAMQNPNQRIRADALRVGLRILDAEPELRASVLQTLDGLDDRWLAGWLERVAGEHAAEVARRAARSTRSATLRLRAAAVERQLQAKAAAAGG